MSIVKLNTSVVNSGTSTKGGSGAILGWIVGLAITAYLGWKYVLPMFNKKTVTEEKPKA